MTIIWKIVEDLVDFWYVIVGHLHAGVTGRKFGHISEQNLDLESIDSQHQTPLYKTQPSSLKIGTSVRDNWWHLTK